MYDYENPVMTWVSRVILFLCVLFAAFSVVTAIMGVKGAKAQMNQYAKEYKKISAEIEELKEKQSGLVGETITAQDLGSAIAKDQNVLSKYADRLYKDTISGEESAAVSDLMNDLSMKLGNAEIASTSSDSGQKEMYFKHVWTKNPKAEVRFETVLKYYTDSIPCLFTIWDGDHFYGYVTGSYDKQAGAITDPVVTFTAYGEKNEPVYTFEEEDSQDTDAIVVPEGASYTAEEIQAILNKDSAERTEEEWNVLYQYWEDNNMEGETRTDAADDAE